ncbi:MAG: hypothetical protein AAFP02_19910, partial [Bacteroidota bacterium]
MKSSTNSGQDFAGNSMDYRSGKRARFWRSGWMIAIYGLFVAMIPLGIMQHGLDNAEAVGAFMNGTLPATTPGGVSNWSVVNAFGDLRFDRAMAM